MVVVVVVNNISSVTQYPQEPTPGSLQLNLLNQIVSYDLLPGMFGHTLGVWDFSCAVSGFGDMKCFCHRC